MRTLLAVQQRGWGWGRQAKVWGSFCCGSGRCFREPALISPRHNDNKLRRTALTSSRNSKKFVCWVGLALQGPAQVLTQGASHPSPGSRPAMLSETPSSCRTDTLRGMEPRRLLLFESGAALGVFPVQQGSTGGEGDTVSVVVMEPSGACFTHVRQVRRHCARG